jgi:hypothetical protein
MRRDPVTLDTRGRVIEPEAELEPTPDVLPWYADDPAGAVEAFGEYAVQRSRASLGELAELAERGVAWAIVGGIALYVLPQIIKRR